MSYISGHFLISHTMTSPEPNLMQMQIVYRAASRAKSAVLETLIERLFTPIIVQHHIK